MTPPVPRADTLDMDSAHVAMFKERMVAMKDQMAAMKVQFAAHDQKDTEQNDKVNNRLSRIELALATALGGMTVLGWFVDKKAQAILDLLSR